MDKNYLDRIKLRRQIMAEHPETVLAARPVIKPAIDEFYSWLLSIYLPTRFPVNFQVCAEPQSGRKSLLNLANGEILDLEPPTSPLQALQVIGSVIEDDCLFLLPSSDGDGYRLEGFVTCFPNGFNTRKKLGLKLRDIHIPVPGYKEKLERSMDRYFDRLEVGKFVKRVNVGCITVMLYFILMENKWTITTTDKLFTASGNHLYERDEVELIDIDIKKEGTSITIHIKYH